MLKKLQLLFFYVLNPFHKLGGIFIKPFIVIYPIGLVPILILLTAFKINNYPNIKEILSGIIVVSLIFLIYTLIELFSRYLEIKIVEREKFDETNIFQLLDLSYKSYPVNNVYFNLNRICAFLSSIIILSFTRNYNPFALIIQLFILKEVFKDLLMNLILSKHWHYINTDSKTNKLIDYSTLEIKLSIYFCIFVFSGLWY